MLGLAIAVLAVLETVGVAPSASGDEAARCPPAASVAGDALLARDVAAALAARGVGPSGVGSCLPVRASVRDAEGEIWVELTDGSGRHVERRTSSVASAATVIESWARTEFTDALLERRAEPAVAVAAAASSSSSSSSSSVPGRVPIFAIAAESSFGSDGSVWSGGRLSACVWLGPVCGGVTLRLAVDPGWTGDSARTGGQRLDGDLLAAFEVMTGGPRFVVVPGLGVGYGFLRSTGRRIETDDSEGEASVDRAGLRAEAHMRIATPLAGGVWLTLTGSASVLPSAHTESLTREESVFPGEPEGFLRIAIGLSSREWP